MTANVSSIPPASPSPSPLHAVVADDFEAVNRTIVTQLNSRVPLVETIGQYIIESGELSGKNFFSSIYVVHVVESR